MLMAVAAGSGACKWNITIPKMMVREMRWIKKSDEMKFGGNVEDLREQDLNVEVMNVDTKQQTCFCLLLLHFMLSRVFIGRHDVSSGI